jgi:hypothetical protein
MGSSTATGCVAHDGPGGAWPFGDHLPSPTPRVPRTRREAGGRSSDARNVCRTCRLPLPAWDSSSAEYVRHRIAASLKRGGGGPGLAALGALRDDGHKSEGSQFDTAAVVLPSRASPVLTRELLDTAVTGARASLILAGTEEAVRAASPGRRRGLLACAGGYGERRPLVDPVRSSRLAAAAYLAGVRDPRVLEAAADAAGGIRAQGAGV